MKGRILGQNKWPSVLKMPIQGPGVASKERQPRECENSELRHSWVGIQKLLLVTCVALGKSLSPSEPHFPLLYNGEKETFLVGNRGPSISSVRVCGVRAQLLISAQAMTSQFVRSSPTLGSVLTAWSLLGILSLPLSLLLPCLRAHALPLSQNK